MTQPTPPLATEKTKDEQFQITSAPIRIVIEIPKIVMVTKNGHIQNET